MLTGSRCHSQNDHSTSRQNQNLFPNYRIKGAVKFLKLTYTQDELLSLWRGNSATMARWYPWQQFNSSISTNNYLVWGMGLQRLKSKWTVLQKLSKCEINAHKSIIHLPLNLVWNQFRHDFWVLKITIFTILETLNIEFCKIWDYRNGSYFLKLNFKKCQKWHFLTFWIHQYLISLEI